jgi:hypothetical protein
METMNELGGLAGAPTEVEIHSLCENSIYMGSVVATKLIIFLTTWY